MAVFPASPVPRYGSSGSNSFLVIRSEFEGNFAQSRRVATRGRKMFSLKYNSLTDAEFTILQNFFDANVGGTFTWVNPYDLVSYTVSFAKDSLSFSYTTKGRIDTKIDLEEV